MHTMASDFHTVGGLSTENQAFTHLASALISSFPCPNELPQTIGIEKLDVAVAAPFERHRDAPGIWLQSSQDAIEGVEMLERLEITLGRNRIGVPSPACPDFCIPRPLACRHAFPDANFSMGSLQIHSFLEDSL